MRRKVLLVAILIIAMLLQCVMPFVTVNAATSVGITLNSNLYKAIKANLQSQGIIAEYKDANGLIIISPSELNKVTRLDLENSEIDDLTGIDAFSKVTSLNLHANKLTEDSNLHALDGLNLVDLDLSSNKIKSIKSLTSFANIRNGDITAQRLTDRQVIKVDDSSETESHGTQVRITLPDILLEDCNRIKSDWLVDSFGTPTRSIISYTDPKTGETTFPEIDFAKSFAPGSSDLVLTIANGTASSFSALRGLVVFKIFVNESTSKIADTDMTFYYAITDSTETGITFDDENMYKAVKKQLTKNQSSNSDLTKITDDRNLYVRAYDEALILVIEDTDIINNIPSLILHDKKIRDIKGIEEFVGLEANIDISYNYIDSIKRILELEVNKGKIEEKIITDFTKMLNALKENVQVYNTESAKKKEAEANYTRARDEFVSLTDPNEKAAKQNEMQGYLDEISSAEDAIARCVPLIEKHVDKLYGIYENEYRLVSLLPTEVNYLSYQEILTANLDTVKGYATSIMDRISNIEQNDALTKFEKWAIVKMITDWGADNGFTYKTEKTVYRVNPTGGDPIPETESIEFPISEFFEEVKADATLELSDFEQFVYIFKCIDALSQVENYSLIKRTFEETPTPSGENFVEDAIKSVRNIYAQKGYDTYFYGLINYNRNIAASALMSGVASNGYEINQGGLYSVNIGLAESEYDGAVSEPDYKLKLAERLSLVNNDEIAMYVSIPRVCRLNIADNNTRNLEGIENLTELQELIAWKNLVNNISNVKWESFKNLKVLNLGFNQISDISPLEKIYTLEELNVSYNLLSGRFTFLLLNMQNLRVADFSHNQYSDIQYANDQFILKAFGYDADGDGRAEGYTVPEYLRAAGIDLSFQYQTIGMETTIIKTSDEFAEFELPLIFRQLEKLDHERTSFGVDSIGGVVDAEGKTVKVRIPEAGAMGTTKVSVQGRNGFGGEVRTGIGYGTVCTIIYEVVEEASITPYEPLIPPSQEQTTPENPETPGNTNNPENPGTTPSNPENPSNPSNPSNPGTQTNPVERNYGYDVSDGFVMVYKPGTTIVEFMSKLVNLAEYNVAVSQNESETTLETGSVVLITSKTDPSFEDILEVVVKGDINGDGEVDGSDSGIIRNVIADRAQVVGAYSSAADVNNDGNIDSLDSMLILKYRADRISSFK